MKENRYFVNIMHIGTISVWILCGVLVRTFLPRTVFPHISIPMLVLCSLIPMVIACRVGEKEKKNFAVSGLLGGITFTVLPLCAGWDIGMPVWKLLLAGTVVFGMTDMLYSSMKLRINSGPCGRFAPETNALILYLASQCLQGLI